MRYTYIGKTRKALLLVLYVEQFWHWGLGPLKSIVQKCLASGPTLWECLYETSVWRPNKLVGMYDKTH